MISIEVKNAKEISKMFADFGKEGAKALQSALYVTALEGASEAKINCPVVTNRLRSSIHAENKLTRSAVYKDNNGLTFNGKLYAVFNDLDAAFGTNVEYAATVNDGMNAQSFKRKSGSWTTVSARSGVGFMEKGVKKAEEKLMDNVFKAYEKLLNNAKS